MGKVAHTSGAIDPASRTLLTEVQVPNPKGELLPGSYAQVTFEISSAVPPLLIPSNALIFRSAGTQAAVVDANHRARLTKITLGRDFGNNLEVLSGLQPSDSVIVNPPDSLAEGTIVMPREADAAPSASPAQNTAGNSN
jgi:multidrug efflux pump subunit AcrA (membrane-fusion protein)